MTERLFASKSKRLAKPYQILIGVGVTLLIIYVLLPRPVQPEDRRIMTADKGRRIVASLQRPAQKPLSEEEHALARFGKALFHDRRLSSEGTKSCADCHSPTQNAKAGARAGLLIDLAEQRWFFHDGRQDNLIGAVLHSIESPDALGSNRTRVVNLMATAYAQQFEAAFGPLQLPTSRPDDGYPNFSTPLDLPLDLASDALSTLTDYQQLESILATARERHQAPVTELTKRGLPTPLLNQNWITDFDAIPEKDRAQINTAFIRVGVALAAYIKTRRTTPSAFDAFASSLATSKTLAGAWRSDFSEPQWRGLALFARDDSCIRCHFGSNFSNGEFHNIGLGSTTNGVYLGRAGGILRLQNSPFTCDDPRMQKLLRNTESCGHTPYLAADKPQHLGAFRTPSLRHQTSTTGYYHDGRTDSLDDVLEHYSYLEVRPAIGRRSPLLSPANFTKEERNDLSAFLQSLASTPTDFEGEPIAPTLSAREHRQN